MEKTAKNASVIMLVPENAELVLKNTFDRPKTEVFVIMSNEKVVNLAAQLLPCQNRSLLKSEY